MAVCSPIRAAHSLFRYSVWHAEPQKPSTPCVPEMTIRILSGREDPIRTTSVYRSSPLGPVCGYLFVKISDRHSIAASRNFLRASSYVLENSGLILHSYARAVDLHRPSISVGTRIHHGSQPLHTSQGQRLGDTAEGRELPRRPRGVKTAEDASDEAERIVREYSKRRDPTESSA